MALLSLDDKMLGEKVNNYCSSSEDEEPQASTASYKNSHVQSGKTTAQTGPKGVIEDWKTYKRLEYEQKERDTLRQNELIKKLAFTCDPKTGLDNSDDIDGDDQEFLQQYHKKRMLELQQKFGSRWTGITFGKLTELSSQNYVEQIEDEKHFVTIIIHIYDDNVAACEAMTGCFHVLAKEYRSVKFCQIKASEARLSENFLNNGLPALLAYKNNTLLGSFVHVSDALGEDFYASDVEEYLKSYGVLPDKDAACEGDKSYDGNSSSSDEE